MSSVYRGTLPIREKNGSSSFLIPEGISIGFDLKADRARGLTVDESGIVVVPRGFRF
ncbi:MAG: hypothetical protein WAT81_05700 [Candidatus Moraniibacteriota bacterium]